jgi:hypothetical protein
MFLFMGVTDIRLAFRWPAFIQNISYDVFLLVIESTDSCARPSTYG